MSTIFHKYIAIFSLISFSQLSKATEASNRDNFIGWNRKEIVVSISHPSPEIEIKYSKIKKVVSNAINSWTKHINISVKIAKKSLRVFQTQEDGINALIFATDPSEYVNSNDHHRKFDSNNLGVTTAYPSLINSDRKKMALSEADIEINLFNNHDVISDQSTDNLTAILVHEYGHFFGLPHSCVASKWEKENSNSDAISICDSRDKEKYLSVMYPNPLEQGRPLTLTPTEYDIRELKKIYANNSSLQSETTTCFLPAVFTIVIVVLGVFLLLLWIGFKKTRQIL